jgi:acetoin utilization protein AcuB
MYKFGNIYTYSIRKGVRMLVRERMSHPVITIWPETSMQDALDLMRKEHVRRLPVVDKKGILLGIITDADLDKASPSEATSLSVWEIRELISKVKVEKIMTRDVITINEDTPIEEAARIMADENISGLPVMRDNKLVGLITETDLFKVLLEMFGAREKGVRVSVEVPKGPGQLNKLTQLVFNLGGDILALGTYIGENSETGQITFKVDGVSKADLTNAIAPQVSRIIDIREI